ncbi:hypothetical protein HYD_5610 [Candidatus Hydrogenosomobacter endosymbioticus]|uniref:LPS export ABC transporter periplasmic protein LptC n=2 Tax=Candidatus Hydrogenosomobacter endosymbioticus TaxID=2558174 RepID=A0ABM7V9H3_9PROT|nr:hypothetical protein HYD_5610 [Candidatus Hydrogenosomobacter endosymbioticus]
MYDGAFPKKAWKSERDSVTDAKFFSIDDKKRQYSFYAKKAQRETSSLFTFLFPKVELKDKNIRYFLDGERASYDKAKEVIKVSGNVSFKDSRKYKITTESASMDMKTKDIFGNALVKGNGPLGVFSAERFKILDHGNRILLNGRAKMVINVNEKR